MVEIVRRIRDGDHEAEQELAVQISQKIYVVVCHRIGKDNEDCEDLVQEIFLATFESLRAGKFNPDLGKPLHSYIYGITLNKLRDYFKHQDRKELLRDDTAEEPVDNTEMESDVEKEERRQLLRNGISNLKDKYRWVLFLRYYEELSIDEISKKIGISRRRVSERINYAIQLLKKECKNLRVFSIFWTLSII